VRGYKIPKGITIKTFNPKRVKEGFRKTYQAMAEDARKPKPSGLPKGWNSRIIREATK